MVSKLDEQDDIVNRKGDPPGNKHPQELVPMSRPST
jgi:hypothetical protein